MTKLKPCPFCGSTPEVDRLDGEWIVSCENPGCRIYPHTSGDDLVDDAIAAWNERTEAQ